MLEIIKILNSLLKFEQQAKTVQEFKKSIGLISCPQDNSKNKKKNKQKPQSQEPENNADTFSMLYSHLLADNLIEDTFSQYEDIKEGQSPKGTLLKQCGKITENLKKKTNKLLDIDDLLSSKLSVELLDILQENSEEQPATLASILNKMEISDHEQKSATKIMLSIINTLKFSDVMSILKIVELDIAPYENLDRIKRAQDQNNIENLLGELDIPFTSITSPEGHDVTKQDRIFYTTLDDTLEGFKMMSFWLKAQRPSLDINHTEALRQHTASRVLEDLKNLGYPELDESMLEIAWGHLMNAHKHRHENAPFIVTSTEAMNAAVENSNTNSTLILDGHGGGGRFSLGEFKDKPIKKLMPDIAKVIESASGKVSHFILSACMTGMLNIDSINQSTLKTDLIDTVSCKDKRKLLVEENDTVKDFFQTLSNGNASLAAEMASLIFNSERGNKSKLAFTFSPCVLIPDSISGNRGYIAQAKDARQSWPAQDESVQWDDDYRVTDGTNDLKQIAMKAYTLYAPMSRKKLGVNAWRTENTPPLEKVVPIKNYRSPLSERPRNL